MSKPAAHDRLATALSPRIDRLTRRTSDRAAPQVAVTTPDGTFNHGGDRPFHTASVGKVFTATLVARLVERGVLAFDTPLGELVTSFPVDTLPTVPGVDAARDITVEHLLSHRSGLPDPMDPPRGHRTGCSISSLASGPDHRWELREFLEQMVGLPPVGRPGERFAYGDGAYALLLCAAEDATGLRFDALLRTHVFEPAGMRDTWHPHDDPAVDLADLDIAEMRLGKVDVSRMRALSAGSFDGGAVTTPADLARFLRALQDGRLIDPGTLEHLARRRSRMRAGIHYGAGLATLRFGELMPVVLRGLPEPVGGLGLTGIHAFSYPEQCAHVVCAFHSTRAMNASFRTHIAIARELTRGAR